MEVLDLGVDTGQGEENQLNLYYPIPLSDSLRISGSQILLGHNTSTLTLSINHKASKTHLQKS